MNNKIQIKVVKATKDTYWYTKYVGQVLDVFVDYNNEWYLPIGQCGTRGTFEKTDVVRIDRREKIEKIMSKI